MEEEIKVENIPNLEDVAKDMFKSLDKHCNEWTKVNTYEVTKFKKQLQQLGIIDD